MSTKLVILGLLRRRQLYGYEIKHMIEDHMGDWTSIAFGSIYFALKKLRETGLVEEVGVEQQGNRPSRTVYAITDAGRAEFGRMLRELWSTPEHRYYDFDIALFFSDGLEPGEAGRLVDQRVGILRSVLGETELHREEQMQNEHVPPIARAIFDHAIAHLKAEISWLEVVRELVD